MLKDLIELANQLDKKGLVKEANYVDGIIKTSDNYQEDWDNFWGDVYQGIDDGKRKDDIKWPEPLGPQQPGSQQPGSQQPGSQQPGSQQPGSQQPGPQQPGPQQPGSQQPGSQQPGSQQPGSQQPGSQQPGSQQPEGEQPEGEQPEGISSRIKNFLSNIADWLRGAWGKLYEKYLKYKEDNGGLDSDGEDAAGLVPILLQDETVDTTAIVLITTGPEIGAETIRQSSEERAAEILSRMAKMERPSEGDLQTVRNMLPDELSVVISSKGLTGIELASKILNLISDENKVDKILSMLDDDIKEKMINSLFTIEDIVDMEDADVRILIQSVEPKVLILAMTEVSQMAYDKVSGVLTADEAAEVANEAAKISEEAVSPQAALDSQAKIVQMALKLSAEGRINLTYSTGSAQQPEAQQPEAQQPEAQQPEAQQLEAQQLEAQQPEAQQPEAQQSEAQQPEAQQLEVTDNNVGIIAEFITSGTFGLEQAWPIIASTTPSLGGRILERLNIDDQIHVLAAIIKREVSQLVVDLTEEELPPHYRAALNLKAPDISGFELAGKILSNVRDVRVRGAIMTSLYDINPVVSETMRDQMLLFDDLFKIKDEDFKILLKNIDNITLLNALKISSEPMKDKIIGNYPMSVSEQILEYLEVMGRVPRKEAEKAQTDIVNIALRLELEGKIKIPRRNDPEIEYV